MVLQKNKSLFLKIKILKTYANLFTFLQINSSSFSLILV
jgi:hypothetical protein